MRPHRNIVPFFKSETHPTRFFAKLKEIAFFIGLLREPIRLFTAITRCTNRSEFAETMADQSSLLWMETHHL